MIGRNLKIVIFVLTLLGLTISVKPQGQTIPRNLVFLIKPDTTYKSGDSLFIQVQVWDSLTTLNLITSGWQLTSPGAQFSYAVNFPWQTAIYGWKGRVEKKTQGGLIDSSAWCSPFYLHTRIVDKSQGCSCLSPANGATIEVLK
jgi:hypothetical protein